MKNSYFPNGTINIPANPIHKIAFQLTKDKNNPIITTIPSNKILAYKDPITPNDIINNAINKEACKFIFYFFLLSTISFPPRPYNVIIQILQLTITDCNILLSGNKFCRGGFVSDTSRVLTAGNQL
ncbi:hypothetical protein AAHB94_08450 [Bacillus toyonensis]